MTVHQRRKVRAASMVISSLVSRESSILLGSTLREAVAVPLDVRGPRLRPRPVTGKFGYTPAVKTDLLLIPMGARWMDMRAAAVAADEAGFDGVWTWDHLRDPEGDPAGVPECLTTLAALAEATKRVSLGSLVLN